MSSSTSVDSPKLSELINELIDKEQEIEYQPISKLTASLNPITNYGYTISNSNTSYTYTTSGVGNGHWGGGGAGWGGANITTTTNTTTNPSITISGGPTIWTTPNTISATNQTWTGTNWTMPAMPKTVIQSGMDVKGDAEFDGDIKIKGKSLTEMLNKIEERLAILHPNMELESKWDKLKKLGEKYRKLEAEILEKEKIWNTIKK